MKLPNIFSVPDDELPAVARQYAEVLDDPEVRDRIWHKIQIEMLAHNREFLNALAWEVDDDIVCQGPSPAGAGDDL